MSGDLLGGVCDRDLPDPFAGVSGGLDDRGLADASPERINDCGVQQRSGVDQAALGAPHLLQAFPHISEPVIDHAENDATSSWPNPLAQSKLAKYVWHLAGCAGGTNHPPGWCRPQTKSREECLMQKEYTYEVTATVRFSDSFDWQAHGRDAAVNAGNPRSGYPSIAIPSPTSAIGGSIPMIEELDGAERCTKDAHLLKSDCLTVSDSEQCEHAGMRTTEIHLVDYEDDFLGCDGCEFCESEELP
jgi:hypothetical protein